MAKTALAVRHVALEDAGILTELLAERQCGLEYLEAPRESVDRAVDCDLLIVLGGPIGVYEDVEYPFLRSELRVLEERLAQQRPTLGICLGAQLMARALGARVYAGQHKEIGWSRLSFTEAGLQSCLQPLAADERAVLHWHGDTFDLPAGATRLASSALYENQAFSYGRHALALQFHAEVLRGALESWYVGHACELAHANISVSTLRSEAERLAPALESTARRCFGRWLDDVLR